MLVCTNCLYYLRHITVISCFSNHNQNGKSTENQLSGYINFMFYHFRIAACKRHTTKKCFFFSTRKAGLTLASNNVNSFLFFCKYTYNNLTKDISNVNRFLIHKALLVFVYKQSQFARQLLSILNFLLADQLKTGEIFREGHLKNQAIHLQKTVISGKIAPVKKLKQVSTTTDFLRYRIIDQQRKSVPGQLKTLVTSVGLLLSYSAY